MKGILHCCCLLRHQRRDKGGNAHNFPFDTLTKVYRDAVYAPQTRYVGNPMYPERDVDAAAPSPPETVVTPSLRHSDNVNDTGDTDIVRDMQRGKSDTSAQPSAHAHSVSHLQPSPRQAATTTATPLSSSTSAQITAGDGGGGAARTADDEAMRDRLRSHLFGSMSPEKRVRMRAVAASSSPASPLSPPPSAGVRYSGVQLEILNTYRGMLREVARMEDAETRRSLAEYIRQEYDKQREVPRKSIMKIEWQLNYAKRKLEDLRTMSTRTKFTMAR